jgi:hypothetical protein
VREKSLGSQADELNPSPVPCRATSPLPPHRDFLLLTVNFRQPSYIILTTATNPQCITSSLLHVDFGVYCLRRKSKLKRRLSG